MEPYYVELVFVFETVKSPLNSIFNVKELQFAPLLPHSYSIAIISKRLHTYKYNILLQSLEPITITVVNVQHSRIEIKLKLG